MASRTIARIESGAHHAPGPGTLAPTLLSLAPELVQIITDHLDTPDIEQFRLTCKTIGALLRPHAFRVLRLKITKNSLRNDVDRLCVLAVSSARSGSVVTEMWPASYGTRMLYIGALAPSYDPSYRGSVWKYVDGEWIAEEEDDDPSEVAFGEDALRMYLFDALASLKGVKSVEWTPNRIESEETQRTVIGALRTLPNLRSVHFSVGQCKIALPLDTLTSLRKIWLSGTGEKHHDETLESLARLVAATPSFTSIDIASNWRHNRPIDHMQSLHALFAQCPRGASPLRIRRLALKAALVRLDNVTLPHLQYLTALSLTSIEDPYARGRYVIEDWHDVESGEATALMKEQIRYGSGLEEMWRVLKGAEIWLEELITVDVVVPALLEYLKSYSGLRKLLMTPGGFDEGMRSDTVADEFYRAALACHALSLQELEVNALFEGKWCFGSHNLGVLASCPNLRALKMNIISEQLNPHNVSTKGVDCVKLLLDTAAFSMPCLDDLQIDAANLEQLRGAFCGNPVAAHFSRTTEVMIQSISEYTAPSSCYRLPSKLSIGNPARHFVSLGAVHGGHSLNANGARLRYVDIALPTQKTSCPSW